MTSTTGPTPPPMKLVPTPIGDFTVMFSREYGAVGTINGAISYVCTCRATDGQCHGSERSA